MFLLYSFFCIVNSCGAFIFILCVSLFFHFVFLLATMNTGTIDLDCPECYYTLEKLMGSCISENVLDLRFLVVVLPTYIDTFSDITGHTHYNESFEDKQQRFSIWLHDLIVKQMIPRHMWQKTFHAAMVCDKDDCICRISYTE